MNILALDQYSDLGGAQRVFLETVEAARRCDWNIWCALPSGPLMDRVESLGASVSRIPCGPYQSGTKGLLDSLRFGSDLLQQVRILHSLINRVHFDLIYVNGPRVLPAAALATRGRAPVLFHAHSHIDQSLARRLAGWSIARTGAAVVACSESVLEPLRKYVEPGNQFVAANGVPEIPFRRRDFPSGGHWRIGVIGRIAPEKGQIEFVRATALLHTEFPEARFVICGAPLFSGASYFREVRELARGRPVEFLGWREDVAGVFSELDLLVVPSLKEGMGRVIIEAFSAGVPVAAFASGGIPEIVTDGETGYLLRDKTAEALARRMREIMRTDQGDLQRIVANARGVWESRYALAIYQERITELIKQLASNRSHARLGASG